MTELSAALDSGVVLAVKSKPLGAPLEDRLREGLTGSLAAQVAVGLRIGRVLAALHATGRCHGALHANCIYINSDDEIRIPDTKAHKSQERDRDIHAFGYVLYELFSAQFHSENGIPKGPPDLEVLYKTGMSPRLVELVRHCTNDASRPRDLKRIVRELESSLRHLAGQPEAPKKKRWIAAAAGLLIALAGTFWMYIR